MPRDSPGQSGHPSYLDVMDSEQSTSAERHPWRGLAAIIFGLVAGVVGFGLLFISGFGHPVSGMLVLYAVAVMTASAGTVVWGVLMASTRSDRWTGTLPTVSVVWMILLVLGIVVAVSPGDSRTRLPSCNGVDRAPTGNLEEDIVGSWSQIGDGLGVSYHPITRFGPGNMIIVFDADGTGRAQWLFVGPAGDEAGETSFEWGVEDDMLMVEDYPPASVRVDTGSARVSNADGEGGTAFWGRCGLQQG